jgi:hypothetical protein
MARGRRMLLAENGFATALGTTLSGQFLTALVLAMGGGALELGVVVAAGNVGALGMLVTNPVLNHVGSRRRVCLFDLGIVRGLRIVIAAMPLLVYLQVGQRSLIWPVVACVCVSAFFGMSAEISRRSWIADLVLPSLRGQFFARRVIIGSSTNVCVLLAGGWVLDYFRKVLHQPLLGPPILIGFGFLMGLVSWILIWRTPEPPMFRPRRAIGLARSLVLPWIQPRVRPLIVAGVSWGLAVGFAADFFSLYMRQHLKMDWVWISVVNTTGELASIAGAPFFGAWSDRAGTRRVLTAYMLIKGVFPALWILVMPSAWPLLFAVMLLSTFNSAGAISWMRLSLNLSPVRNQAAYLSMHQAMMGVGQALGSVLGGCLVFALKNVEMGSVLGIKLVPLHLLFALSAGLRLSCMLTLRFIREPRRALNSTQAAARPLPEPAA